MNVKYIRPISRMVPQKLAIIIERKYSVELIYVYIESYPGTSFLLRSREPVDSRTAFLLDIELSEYITNH
jgi:hypothetical protein